VLRLRAGDAVTVSDGAGGRLACRFGPALEPVGEIERVERTEPQVTVAFAVVKGQRPEWAVQKLTELGVDRIVPLLAARSVVRWPAGQAGTQVERLRRVAREASVQSRRVWLPVVLVGPEGGWSEVELSFAGPARVGLGPAVLRTETAAVVAGTLLCALRAGVVTES